jgi:RNA 2',3'-cyclic 3'-phosphodiesterase
MQRLFTGISLPATTRLDLKFMQTGIKGAKWIDPADFHVTLCFVGDVDNRIARELALELSRQQTEAFALTLKSVDVFGSKKPHAIVVGVEENEELLSLQRAQERLCRMLGIEIETRKFIPHVTIARLNRTDPLDLKKFVEAHVAYKSEPVVVNQFHLYSAKPSTGGGPYAVEHSYGLYEND